MSYFRQHYAEPSLLLSMERAREYDRVSEFFDFDDVPRGDGAGLAAVPSSPNGIDSRNRNFDKDAFRQPVLTERGIEPLPYRRGKTDELTMKAKEQLSQINDGTQHVNVGNLNAGNGSARNSRPPRSSMGTNGDLLNEV